MAGTDCYTANKLNNVLLHWDDQVKIDAFVHHCQVETVNINVLLLLAVVVIITDNHSNVYNFTFRRCILDG